MPPTIHSAQHHSFMLPPDGLLARGLLAAKEGLAAVEPEAPATAMLGAAGAVFGTGRMAAYAGPLAYVRISLPGPVRCAPVPSARAPDDRRSSYEIRRPRRLPLLVDVNAARGEVAGGAGEVGRGAPRLYTFTMDAPTGYGHLHAFGAVVDDGEASAARRFRAGHPDVFVEHATVRAGFDWSQPLANELVSGALANILSLVEQAPLSPLAEGLDIRIEQRFRR